MGNKPLTGIHELPGGGWLVRAQKTDPRTGKLKWRKQKLPPGSSIGAAVLARDALVRGVVTGTSVSTDETLTAYSRSWLERRLPRLGSEGTRQRYAEALTLHILPKIGPEEALGNFYVTKIRKRDLETWLARSAGLDRSSHRPAVDGRVRKPAPYSAETVNGWWRILKSVMQDAVIEYGLTVDPTMGIEPLPLHARPKSKSNTLSAEELHALLEHCLREAPQWFAFLMLGFSIGARPGELRPLRWDEDLDPHTGRLTLQQSQRRKQLGPTKTKEPRETLLHRPVLDALLWHRQFLKQTRHPGATSGLVFPGFGDWRPWHHTGIRPASGVCFLSPGALDKPLADMRKAVGIKRPITPKAMRRTFNDLCLDRNVDPLVIRSMTGHKSDDMRGRYTTVKMERQREASATVIAMMPATPVAGPLDEAAARVDGGVRARLRYRARAKSRAKLNVNSGPHVAPSDTEEVA